MIHPLTKPLLIVLQLVCLACLLATGNSRAESADVSMAERIQKQLNAVGRGEYDSIKDPSRKPVETMQFFGVKEGMTVLDATTGSGYNAEILSAAVGSSGLVYAQNSHYVLTLINGAHHKAMLDRLENERLGNVRYMIVDVDDMPFASADGQVREWKISRKGVAQFLALAAQVPDFVGQSVALSGTGAPAAA